VYQWGRSVNCVAVATVEHIHIASKSGAPVDSLDEVEVVAGKGLAGDRNFDKYSKGQITVVSTEELAEAAAAWGSDIEPGSTRRNVTVSGFQLPREPGSQFRMGQVVVEVYRDASPCELMNDSVGPGAREHLRGRAGIRGLVIEGGRLRVGDEVEGP